MRTDFTQRKTLVRQFWRIRVNENDLAHLAVRVQNLAKKYNSSIGIQIVSVDGEDEILTSAPEFFTSVAMPIHIGSVAISYQVKKSPVSCSVKLNAFPPQYLRQL